jgi:putative tryptophan/tyrosine transport system substrate-binding protein
MQALREAFRGLGYVEGRNLQLEERRANLDTVRVEALAAELVAMRADALVATSTLTAQALQRATSTVPIVVSATADPVADGFARTLARPGGNVTGFSTSAGDTVVKHLEMLAGMEPRPARISVLANPGSRAHPPQVASLRQAAAQAGLSVSMVEAGRLEDIDRAFGKAVADRASAMIVLNDGLFGNRYREVGAAGLKHRLPVAVGISLFVGDGVLYSYGPDLTDLTRRCAGIVDRILRGARPGDIPFEQPNLFELVLNGAAARAYGLRFSRPLLARADKVIE